MLARAPRTPEAIAVARFMDTLPEETRIYLHQMVYRVAGVEPPPPPKAHRLPPKKVISLLRVRRAAGGM